ncbi:MAG TPA: FG-GAP-like repeat-containing protein [Bacteroidales bacterium]|nr:FG-GAP-like repeat-containing protein [Bacteroidales bacterium]
MKSTKFFVLFVLFFYCTISKSQNCSSNWLINEVTKPAVTNPSYKPGWTLVFDDEFNGTTLEPSKWKNHHGRIGSPPYGFMDPNNVEVANGYCNIKLTRINDYRTDPNNGYYGYFQFTCGWIESSKKFGPGTFWEIKAKRNKIGFKSSFWAFDMGGVEPEDQFSVFDNEFRNENSLRMLGFNANNNGIEFNQTINLSNSLPTQDNSFYTYSYFYGVGSQAVFINNQKALHDISHFPTVPMALNLWDADIYWDPDYMNTINYESEFKIDYVRVYEKNSEVETPVSEFGPHNGWNSQNDRPRFIGDVNGDGKMDLIGFGYQDLKVSLSNCGSKNTSFSSVQYPLQAFTKEQGWSTQDIRPRLIGDVNGDNKADIVGFGVNSVQVALSTSTSTVASFTSLQWVKSDYTVEQGYLNMNEYPRALGDVNGDGKLDIVGFYDDGTYISLSRSSSSTASFYDPIKVTSSFGKISGSWESQDKYPRFLADVNGDGKDDIVGFGNSGVYVAISKSTSTTPSFYATQNVLSYFGYNNGFYNNSEYPRYLADVNGDGKDDIVGFGNSGVYVAISNSSATSASFYSATWELGYFTKAQGFYDNNEYPRMVIDINGDSKADIIGFNNTEIEAAISNSGSTNASFYNQNLIFDDFTGCKGWVNQATYPRFVGDINNDGYNDIVGYGYAKVHTFIGFNPNTYTPLNSTKSADQPLSYLDNSSKIINNIEAEIYPNPVLSELNLTSNSVIKYIQIYNISGSLVFSKILNNEIGTFNISHLDNGLYLINLYFENGMLSKKFLKE